MWRASKRLVVDFFNCVGRCIHPRPDFNDLDDISDYIEIEDVPVNFQQQTFRPLPTVVEQQEQQQQQQQHCEPLQHRPDAPGIRRHSPPEIVIKVRQAIEEMMIQNEELCDNAKGNHTFNMYNQRLVKW